MDFASNSQINLVVEKCSVLEAVSSNIPGRTKTDHRVPADRRNTDVTGQSGHFEVDNLCEDEAGVIPRGSADIAKKRKDTGGGSKNRYDVGCGWMPRHMFVTGRSGRGQTWFRQCKGNGDVCLYFKASVNTI